MFNQSVIAGNLGADPELRGTGSGEMVCNLRVATSRVWTRDGERKEETEWHRVTVFGEAAKACDKFLTKGRRVLVAGRIQTRSWEDKSGSRRYTTEIIAHTVQFLDRPPSSGQASGTDTPRSGQDGWPGRNDEDDIPF